MYYITASNKMSVDRFLWIPWKVHFFKILYFGGIAVFSTEQMTDHCFIANMYIYLLFFTISFDCNTFIAGQLFTILTGTLQLENAHCCVTYCIRFVQGYPATGKCALLCYLFTGLIIHDVTNLYLAEPKPIANENYWSKPHQHNYVAV